MLPDRVSNPGPLTYESGALPIALRGPARVMVMDSVVCLCVLIIWVTAGQMPAVVEQIRNGAFFVMCVCF